MIISIWIVVSIVYQFVAVPSTAVTEDVIEKYLKGIEELQNSFNGNPPETKPYDPLKYDEVAALKSAQEYDFVIVGAGASGSVIANRLSEIPNWKILLLEAGDYETPITQIPGMAGPVLGSKYDWRYVTEPQDTWCFAMSEKKCTTPTGKGFGGGTIINGMVYSRGNPRDYDLWAAQGNSGWSYADVLPYFKKAECCKLENCDQMYHGQNGPLHVETTQAASPLLPTFLQAGKDLGYRVVDYNAEEQIGFSRSQATTKQGKRHSAAQAYLLPVKHRKNLHVKQLSHVTQIMIAPHSMTATGVKYIHNETLYIAKARKEVIVSAGPFNSPQLLMLSGIGSQEDLAKLEIPLVKNLPVGKYLKDHAAFQGLNFLLNVTKVAEPNLREQVATWLTSGKGELASVAGTGLAFVNATEADYPDVELILGKARFFNGLRIKEQYKKVLEPASDCETLRIDVMPTRPKSVGSVRLRSKNPYDMPLINTRQYSDPGGHDIATVLGGIKKVFELIYTPAFQKLGARVYTEPIPDCKHLGFGKDAYWKCAVRYLSICVRHQTGTCKMGPEIDKLAVVDDRLRVYGVRRLRVADSSVIPVSITGHTHAASNMVGEKAADLIKQDWQ